MSSLESFTALTREASALAAGTPMTRSGPAETEVARQMQICNACRYCEGFCAVFPAMTRRLEFDAPDVHYLANLCHNCGACLHACQYAPPNAFAVNVPQAMARVRHQTYQTYAWPRAFGALYQRNGVVVAIVLTLALAAFLAATLAARGTLWQTVEAGSFYAIFPHGVLVGMFAPVFGFACLALILGLLNFWRDVRPLSPSGAAAPIGAAAGAQAAHDAMSLTYLGGGHGEGCHESDDGATLWRRRFHHLTAYGFALCFAATSVATLYHYGLGLIAPYPFLSLPVLLGTVGGIGLMVGPAGLFWLNLKRHPDHGDVSTRPMDRAFIALLGLCGASGIALLAARSGPALPLTLAIHLGAVMAFFLTLPYGKFAHAPYRVAALLKFAVEKRMPSRLRLGSD